MRKRDRQTQRRTRLALLLGVVALLAAIPFTAFAHGGGDAAAKRPSFNGNTQRLSGGGAFGTGRRHNTLKVTVCLEKLYGERYFSVRCESNSRSVASIVRARVSVPGCVRGAWRTVVSGEAIGRDGTVKHQGSDVSAVFRC